MTASKLSSAIPNNEVGVYFTKSRRVVVGTSFGELATWIKSGSAGLVVWHNSYTDEYGVWELESGEVAPIACTSIVTSATIDGVLETTTATNMLWATCAGNLGEKTGY